MDITNNINGIMNMFFYIIREAYSNLENIEFWGINMLEFSITIFILSVVIPIIFTIVKSGTSTIGKAGKELYKRSK